MSISIFLSTVSDEFRAYRDQLRGDLTRHNVAVKVQEDFKGLGGDMLDKLDVYIAHCDAVVHLVGEMTGSAPDKREEQALLRKYLDLPAHLPPLDDALRQGTKISYTQWEAWLALYHGKLLLMAKAEPAAPRGPRFLPTDQSRAAQDAHLSRLKMVRRYPDCTFKSDADLAKHIAYTAILDLLVKDYASEAARARDVAEGFIREMAGRVAADQQLDLEGMKQAVRTAIDIYEQEIAGGRTQTNLGEIVDRALANAKRLADEGKSRLARVTLRKAADALRREEEERRLHYVESVRALYGRERDIALASYDGEAAADAIVHMAESLHENQLRARREMLIAEGDNLYKFGDQRGSNIHLLAAIAIRQATLRLAATPDEKGFDQNKLGIALATLGRRESGTARLEEAVSTFRATLKERTRERVPLDWAMTQTHLGNALAMLGDQATFLPDRQDVGMARLEEAVHAFQEALKVYTRERFPLEAATVKTSLGNALSTLGRLEGGTARLEEAVSTFREALKERSREPFEWALTQMNLGIALEVLGSREFEIPGRREAGIVRLGEAVSIFREVLKVYTREHRPLAWAATKTNMGNALLMLGIEETGTARLEEAVHAFREALKERTHEREPLGWAMTQMNLGYALLTLGSREEGITWLEQAIAAYDAALIVFVLTSPDHYAPLCRTNQGKAVTLLAQRQG